MQVQFLHTVRFLSSFLLSLYVLITQIQQRKPAIIASLHRIKSKLVAESNRLCFCRIAYDVSTSYLATPLPTIANNYFCPQKSDPHDLQLISYWKIHWKCKITWNGCEKVWLWLLRIECNSIGDSTLGATNSKHSLENGMRTKQQNACWIWNKHESLWFIWTVIV